jgi:uncharacterized protein GlcG (DUF336 family)
MSQINHFKLAVYGLLASGLALGASPAAGQGAECGGLPSHADLKSQLEAVVGGDNAGLGNEMWASTVNRDGIVCAVAFSGGDRDDQWPGSRVISAQKANTANAFSLEAGNGAGIALSSGNLYGVVLEQGSLYGLQFSNPVDTGIAYGGPNHAGGNANNYGQPNDPMVGAFIGGVNVFGGGLALYDSTGLLLGGLGVSGDTSCTDHIVAWRVREFLGLDNVPGGVGGNNTDNLNIADPVTPNTFEHPNCGNQGEVEIIDALDGDPAP